MAAQAAAADTPQAGPRTRHGRAPQLYHQRRVSQYPQGSETFCVICIRLLIRFASASIFASY
jgi:hypothetical protein